MKRNVEIIILCARDSVFLTARYFENPHKSLSFFLSGFLMTMTYTYVRNITVFWWGKRSVQESDPVKSMFNAKVEASTCGSKLDLILEKSCQLLESVKLHLPMKQLLWRRKQLRKNLLRNTKAVMSWSWQSKRANPGTLQEYLPPQKSNFSSIPILCHQM